MFHFPLHVGGAGQVFYPDRSFTNYSRHKIDLFSGNSMVNISTLYTITFLLNNDVDMTE